MPRLPTIAHRSSGPDADREYRVKCMSHPVDVHVGKRIRQRRWATGTTQQQLAAKVGIKFQQIQKYETGANRVSASRLWDIAGALDVPVAFFFDGQGDAGERPSEPSPSDLLSEREAVELLRAYHAIPEVQRRRLFDLARALSSTALAPVPERAPGQMTASLTER